MLVTKGQILHDSIYVRYLDAIDLMFVSPQIYMLKPNSPCGGIWS